MEKKLALMEGVAVAEEIAKNWDQIRNFQARPRDVLIDTYPKSGTTWMQEIIDLIIHDGDEVLCRRAPLSDRVPSLEFLHFMKPGILCSRGTVFREESIQDTLKSQIKTGKEEVDARPSPRMLKCHLPIQLVPPSFWEHNCKVIYVARNAKDTVTSYYHFDHSVMFHPEPGTWEDYLQRFMKGDMGFGSWYDHVKGFWEQKDKRNILFMFYEDLKKTPLQEIRKVAQFLGKDLSEDILNTIVRLSSFEHMKDNPMANFSYFPKELLDHSKAKLMRKGTVGDWKTQFTDEQIKMFEEHYKSQMGSCNLKFKNRDEE